MSTNSRYLYCFPCFNLELCGDHSNIRGAIEDLLRLLPDSSDSTCRKIQMHIRTLYDDEVSVLPEFIMQSFGNKEALVDPAFVREGNASIGFVDFHEGVFAACYYMPEDSRIEFVVVIDKKYKNPSLIFRSPFSITSVLIPMFREIFLENQQVLFHSAALACPDGTGMLLLADSGGGKTTTSLSLMRLGSKLLGDDLIIAGEENSAFFLHGFPEPLNLTEQTIAFYDELAYLKSLETPAGSKVIFSPQDIYGPFCFQEKVPLNVVYIVHKSQGTPYVEQLSTQESLGFLLRAHTFARCQSISRIALGRIYQIIDSVPVYRLHTGNDPVALGKWLLDSAHDHAQGTFIGR